MKDNEKPWDGSVNALDVYIKTESEDVVLVGKIELMNEAEGRLHYKFDYYDENVNIGHVLFEQDKITVEFTDQEGVDKKLVFTECVQTYKDYIEMFGEQQVRLPSFDGPPGTYDDEPFDHIATYYRGEWHSIKPRNYQRVDKVPGGTRSTRFFVE
ncbi:hypothetical protein [Calditerricola satsumensis]|uniref:hypothetical protein n=1 Tax=Calditerricola satsumensis TaxID=373054 RepID=UPI00210C408E|nr:hypothetical protein [Calditerricola satsumensis]